jgi:hypothetical protein
MNNPGPETPAPAESASGPAALAAWLAKMFLFAWFAFAAAVLAAIAFGSSPASRIAWFAAVLAGLFLVFRAVNLRRRAHEC